MASLKKLEGTKYASGSQQSCIDILTEKNAIKGMKVLS